MDLQDHLTNLFTTFLKNIIMLFKNLNGRLLSAFCCVAIATSTLVACDKDDDDDDNNQAGIYTLSGNASGAQMVPSVTGNGTGTITGTYNSNTRALNYTSNWNGLSGAPTSGGFYGGATGVNGSAIGSPWNLGTNPLATGNVSGNMTLTDAQATDLMNGNWYYSMGTGTNTNGEIRGQMTATAATTP
jgi:hypothetical protein